MTLRKIALSKEVISNAFPIDSDSIIAVKPNTIGLVNSTFHIILHEDDKNIDKYILQRINTYAFKNPDQLMENIVNVTNFIGKKAISEGKDPNRETMKVLSTRNGENYYTAEDGSCWRIYSTIENTYCLSQVENPQQFYESARAFGNFQYLLSDFDASTLHETIEKFHDTRVRYENFEKALAADEHDRAKDVSDEISFVKAHKEDCSYLMDRQEAGILPLRVTHNDTKLNNVLFDSKTDEAITVIDLDTVMPGLSVNDFGDSIRFGANTASEDEKDLNKVNLDLVLFESYTKGFIETCGETLTDAEIDDLYWGAKMMTLECGIRFLTDYLDGDKYFSLDYPEQNLDRARTQFKLVREIENNEEAIRAIIDKYRPKNN